MQNITFNHEITHLIKELKDIEKTANDFLNSLIDTEEKSVQTFELEQAIYEITTALNSFESLLK